MILKQLTLVDFRVFQGTNTLDLSPRNEGGTDQPIVLFGGLNGAGKTSILTAIRHVLYGKQALGPGVSNKAYDDFLNASIHRSKSSVLQPSGASIELTFSYASLGVVKLYSVKRTWLQKGKKTVEELTITEDGKLLHELNKEQCQGFLNELIPIGVSDLFFFDGEKIAELAEDASGYALGDSIKKLLGLDLIETLDMDLTLLLRNKSKLNASKELQKNITALEIQLEQVEAQAAEELHEYEQAKPAEAHAQRKIEKLENSLSTKGGAWAKTRESELIKQTELEVKKGLLEGQIREMLADTFPISISEDFANKTLKQLANEKKYKAVVNTSKIVKSHLDSIQSNLKGILDKSNFEKANQLIHSEFSQLLNTEHELKLIHDVSDSALLSIESTISDACGKDKEKLALLVNKLTDTREQLEDVVKNIARAPASEQIKPIIDEINKEQEIKVQSIKAQASHLEKYKRSLRDAMEIVKDLDKLSEALGSESDKDRSVYLCTQARSLLKEFGREMAGQKVLELERELMRSFERLSRKEDIQLNVEIDPKTFSVRLTGEDGRSIDKNELSAGEKQIYAISILEALARTSGRNLPIIIDTPLGRLDSIHRGNLIQNYFPHASHQVIMLSTDTEVDESFYAELEPEISHSFKLEYFSLSGSTTAEEEYFWKTAEKEAHRHVA